MIKEKIFKLIMQACKETWNEKTCKQIKEALEQNTWIPCSKKTPEYNGWYECTVISDNLLRTIDLFYKDGKWLDNRKINMFDVYDIYGYGNSTEKHKLSYEELISVDWTEDVIAWMPRPEAYDPETNDGNMGE